MSTNVIVCSTFKSRFLGLMFQRNIKNALCFPRCNSIHTFFMRVPIFVVITNIEHTVLFCKVVPPWRIILPIKGGYYTYEFPVGEIDIKKGTNFKGI